MRSRLNYKVIGSSGATIVMLHGWGMGSAVWGPLLDMLSKSHQVILMDLPGYGDNHALSDNYNLQSICEEVSKIIPGQSIILGWSMGGLVAMWLAVYYPSLVGKLILTNSTPCFVKHDDWPGVYRATLDSFKQNLANSINKTLLRFISLQLSLKTHKGILKEQQFLKDIAINNGCSQETLAGGLDILGDTDLRFLLARIKSSVLWVLGEGDVLVPASISRWINNYLPHVEVKVMPGASHVPFISHQEQFLKIIEEFIYV